MRLTVSFPVGVLGDISHVELYSELYKGITEVIDEIGVAGIQIYPSKWPRKVLITLKGEDVKEALMIAGITVLGQHIELRDESQNLVKVTIKDALITWPDEKIGAMLEPYGKVVKIERETLFVNGKKTNWTTGTRFAHMCPLEYNIPQRLTTVDEGKQVSVFVWYKRPPGGETLRCQKCGGEHAQAQCSFQNRVCFVCQEQHQRKECPKYDGSRVSKEVFCFMSEKSPLSNFNTEYPVRINNWHYLCNEQYILSEKARLFRDEDKFYAIRSATDPYEMKRLGRSIRGYVDAVWKEHSEELIMTCVRQKVFQHQELQDYLLEKTGDRTIGEGTSDRHFGVGMHISNPDVMNPNKWIEQQSDGSCTDDCPW